MPKSLARLTACAALFLPFGGLSAERSAVQHYTTPGSTRPFSAAVRVGDILYLSGQIGTAPDGSLSPDFTTQARQTMDNVAATAALTGASMDDIFKCTVMLADMEKWPAFNGIYATYFKPGRLPARSAFGANGLAMGAALEVECLAHSPAK